MSQKFKSLTVTRENYRRMQRLGLGGQSMNDVVAHMLEVAEPPILEELRRSLQQEEDTAADAGAGAVTAKEQEAYQKQVAEELARTEAATITTTISGDQQ